MEDVQKKKKKEKKTKNGDLYSRLLEGVEPIGGNT